MTEPSEQRKLTDQMLECLKQAKEEGRLFQLPSDWSDERMRAIKLIPQLKALLNKLDSLGFVPSPAYTQYFKSGDNLELSDKQGDQLGTDPNCISRCRKK